MNKTAIRNFAVWARNKLLAEITYKAGLLGITEKGIKHPLPQSTRDVQFFDIGTKEPYSITGVEIEQRRNVVEMIQLKEEQTDYKTAYTSVMEEVAYTWFNRLIAVRFMEVNDYLPSGVRVLSAESRSKLEPDLVTAPFDADLDYLPDEKDKIMRLKNDNQLDELFRMLFIKQCNALNDILPELFEKTDDFTELLMNVSFTDKDGVVYRLVHDIPEDDFKHAVEIIGWLYQYYISERHDKVINVLGKATIKKDDIPAATQLFTTDWVVRYLVDNSLGRYWLERNPESGLKEKLSFYFASPNERYREEKVDPKELTFFDPCMGSGHMLVYAFDVLMSMYKECGYSERDAAVAIITHNLYGMDIDDRAYQLAYFAVLMKARSYNRRILTMNLSPHLCSFQESNGLEKFGYEGMEDDPSQQAIGDYVIKAFKHAKEIGSLKQIEALDYRQFSTYLLSCMPQGQLDFHAAFWFDHTRPLMIKLAKQAEMMARKYSVVVTNPPYMNRMEGELKAYVVSQYKAYSSDLFSVFIYRNLEYCVPGGYSAYMTPSVWMFLIAYENLRKYIITNKSIVTFIQMAKGAFFKEATVDICAFVLQNDDSTPIGIYIGLEAFKGDMDLQREKVLEAKDGEDCRYVYKTNLNTFQKIDGYPIAYWASEAMQAVFNEENLYEFTLSDGQNITGDNDRFLRYSWEVAAPQVGQNAKWALCAKGGAYRKWYGNTIDIIDWSEAARKHYKRDKIARIIPEYLWFKACITWSNITSYKASFRVVEEGYLFEKKGASIFIKEPSDFTIILALLNSKVAEAILKVITQAISFQVRDIRSIPFFQTVRQFKDQIEPLASACIDISRKDWNYLELSWDFVRTPLLDYKETGYIRDAFQSWSASTETLFAQLKDNEEKLNRLFIELYGLDGELTPEVEDKDVTIRKADCARDVRAFLSYAVGCMFGRYSLDAEGVAYAGGQWEESNYSTFIPDKDNVIPITDEPYLEDDIVGLLCAFLQQSFGSDTLEENLDFIAKALGNKGVTSREVIRNYFLKDFYKDHGKLYQKRPIYWLFDSGKEDGFKALIYMHRYHEDTIGNLRIDYLHRMQRVYESEIARMQETMDNSDQTREVAAAAKRKDKLTKQLKETKEYDEKIAHLALARISLDLDDGVKVNYDKIQLGADHKHLGVLAKI